MNEWIWLILLAVAPVSELRGSIPYGIVRGMPAFPVIVVSIAANIVTGILVYFFLDRLVALFLNFSVFNRYYSGIVERSQQKIKAQVDRYGWIGVAIFIGIPLPFTGAWTGALGSYLIGLERRKAVIAIILGVLAAGIIVSAVVLSGVSISSIFIKNV